MNLDPDLPIPPSFTLRRVVSDFTPAPSATPTPCPTAMSTTETLQLFGQPYGISGIFLHLLMYYALICIAGNSRSPLTLRPLRHHVYTAILCLFSGLASATIVTINLLHTNRDTPYATVDVFWFGIFAVNACLPLFLGVWGMVAMLKKRREDAEHGNSDTDEKDEKLALTTGFLYIFCAIVGMVSLYTVAQDGWDKVAMRAVCITALSAYVACSVIFAAVAGNCMKVDRLDTPIGKACGMYCVTMAGLAVAALPLALDVVLAISAGNPWGVPMGELVEVVALYTAYITACVLTALSA